MNDQTKGPRGATHTPGPWQGSNARYGAIHKNWRVYSDTGEAIAFVENMAQGDATFYNAALISAAPELLTALEALFEHCAMVHKHWGDGCNREQANAAQDAARAAIAKAKAR